MAIKITDECINCGACEPACPVEAIFYEDDVPEQGVHVSWPGWGRGAPREAPAGRRRSLRGIGDGLTVYEIP